MRLGSSCSHAEQLGRRRASPVTDGLVAAVPSPIAAAVAEHAASDLLGFLLLEQHPRQRPQAEPDHDEGDAEHRSGLDQAGRQTDQLGQ